MNEIVTLCFYPINIKDHIERRGIQEVFKRYPKIDDESLEKTQKNPCKRS